MDDDLGVWYQKEEGRIGPSFPSRKTQSQQMGGQGTWMEDPEVVAQLRNNVLTAGTITVSLSCDR